MESNISDVCCFIDGYPVLGRLSCIISVFLTGTFSEFIVWAVK